MIGKRPVSQAKFKTYKDIDLDFSQHPVTGDIVAVTNELAIKESVLNLILIRNKEYRFLPWIGSPIMNLMFEPFSTMTAIKLQRAIEDVLISFEPRVEVKRIRVTPNESQRRYDISLMLRIKNTKTIFEMGLELEKLR